MTHCHVPPLMHDQETTPNRAAGGNGAQAGRGAGGGRAGAEDRAESTSVQYTKKLTYKAPVATVYAMIIDPGFQEKRSKVGRPQHAEVAVVPGVGDGATVTLTRKMAIDLPAFLKKVAKPTFTLTEVQTWPDAAGDGAQGRTGTLRATVAGYSGGTTGTMKLSESTGVTTVDINADITVKIPLVGGKIEKVAAGMLDKLLSRDQKIGEDWLKAAKAG